VALTTVITIAAMLTLVGNGDGDDDGDDDGNLDDDDAFDDNGMALAT